MGRYAEAVRSYDRALALAPDLHEAAIARGWTYFSWQGRLDTLRAVLSRLPRDAQLRGGTVAEARADLLFWERNADGLLQMPPPSALYVAWAYQMCGDHRAARAAFDSARVGLDSLVRERPDDDLTHYARGMAFAGLGRRDEALREARWLQQSVVYREDALWGPGQAVNRALILAHVGDAEAALDEIEPLLAGRRVFGPSASGPSGVSVRTLLLYPLWDPIRDHQRFKTLLAKYGSGAAR
jgi:serine/threonine-protein kinase